MDHWNSYSLDFYQKLMVFNNDEMKYYDENKLSLLLFNLITWYKFFSVEIEVIKLTAIKLCVTLWPLGTLDFTQNGTASTIEIEDCSKFPNGCCQDLNKNHLPAPGPNQAGCPTHCQCNPLGIVLSPFFTFLHSTPHLSQLRQLSSDEGTEAKSF